jgi:hypothetical protein
VGGSCPGEWLWGSVAWKGNQLLRGVLLRGGPQAPARQVFERVKSVMQVQKAGDNAPYRVRTRRTCPPPSRVWVYSGCTLTPGSAAMQWSGECVVQLVRKEGLYNGLFRGLDATVAREIPQFAVYYPAVRNSTPALIERLNTSGPCHPLRSMRAVRAAAAVLQEPAACGVVG